MQPRAAEIQIPAPLLLARIGLKPPWRKRSLPKTLSASSSTLVLSTPFRQCLWTEAARRGFFKRNKLEIYGGSRHD
jgi:hypothetical protein